MNINNIKLNFKQNKTSSYNAKNVIKKCPKKVQNFLIFFKKTVDFFF